MSSTLETAPEQVRQIAEALNGVLARDPAGPAREARLQARDWGFGPSDAMIKEMTAVLVQA